MSNALRHLISPIAAMVAILAFGMVTPARADLEIWASTTDNPPVSPGDVLVTATSGTSASFSGAVGGFTVTTLSTSSNSPGTPSIGQLFGSTTTITNNGPGTATLYITMGDTGFTAPATPPNINLASHIGGTVPISDSANLLTYQSYVDPTNTQNNLAGSTSGAQTPGITGGSFSSDASALITSLSGKYSVTEYFAITLSSGSEINFSSSTTLTPTPEPSSLAIVGIGALGMVGYGLRRRKAQGV